MGIGHNSLNDSTLLTEARTTYSTLFANALKSANGFWYENLTTLVQGSGRTIKMPFLGQLPAMREWLGARQFESFSRYANQAIVKTYEGSVAVDVDDIEDDQLGGYKSLFEDLAYNLAQWPQDIVGALIKANSACWDGQNFFDASHPVQPGVAGSATYSNVFTSTALSESNFVAVKSAMMTIKGRDGRPIGFGRKPMLVVPVALETTARKLVVAQQINGGDSNTLAGAAGLLVVPELGTAFGGSDTSWYMADVGHSVKPLVFAKSGTPYLRSDTTKEFTDNVVLFGTKARGAAAYGMPFLMAKASA